MSIQTVSGQKMTRQHYKVSGYRSQTSIGYLMKRGHGLTMDLLEPQLARYDLTFVQYVVLMMLRDGLALNPKDICLQFRYDSGALTRIIDQLVERGLVERQRGDRDRRKVELQLTAAGRKAIDRVLPAVVEALNLALSVFTAAEVQELTRLLTKLTTHLQATVESRPAAAVGS